FGGFSANVNYELHTRHVQKGGHLQIQHRDFYLYGSGNPTAYGIVEYEKILTTIQEDPVLKKMVLVATPTLQFGGIAGNYGAGVSRTVIGTGLVAADINQMRLWNDFNLRTKAPLSALNGAATDATVVGTGVARVLQLCDALKIDRCPKPETQTKSDGDDLPDDIAHLSMQDAPAAPSTAGAASRRIEMLVVNARGAPNVTSLEVIRAEDQGVKELDEVSMMMHLSQLQQLIYGKTPPRATSIMIQ
ncbi:ABC transporter permease, partial [bacterium]|nr:ABC transporter permease [bacterium]